MGASIEAIGSTFTYNGYQLAYTEYGEGRRPFILLHGQLLNQNMHETLAKDLAARGNRVITLDLLGHGASSRPRDMALYSFTQFADQVVALLNHLELREAVIGGSSLGANVTLEVAVMAPKRARALMIEMPVLDHGAYGAVVAFTPLLTLFMYAMPLVNVVGRLTRLVPRRGIGLLANIILDTMRQDNGVAPYILQGLFLGRIAPPHELRREIAVPALVIGHPGDPIHPDVDAKALADEMPRGRFVEANNIFELRLHPDRLTGEIAAFLDEVWEPAESPRPSRRRTPGRRGGQSSVKKGRRPTSQ